MPTYNYQCKECSKIWETEQKITEDPIQECPYCGKLEAKRLISDRTAFQLMGGGWSGEGYSS